MKSKRLLKFILSLCFLVPALIFVENYVQEYLKGETFFVETHEPLSLNDVPTISYCAGWPYIVHRRNDQRLRGCEGSRLHCGNFLDDIKMLIKFGGGSKYLLTLNNTIQYHGLEMRLEKFSPYPMIPPYTETCFRILSTPMSEDGDAIIDSDFSLKMTFQHPNSTPFKQLLAITSEENSYGIAQNKWFDGKVDAIQLQTNNADRRTRRTSLKIEDITEYRYLKSRCSKDSYYQCLADHFVKFNFRNFSENNREICSGRGNTVKDMETKCSPVSLPFRGKKILPICETRAAKKCFQGALENQMLLQGRNCRKACRVKEYKVSAYHFELARASHTTEVRFELPDSTRGQMSKVPMKIIREEHYIISGLAFLGNVGGILGIFVGFSILGASEWITSVIESLHKRMGSKFKRRHMRKKLNLPTKWPQFT